MVFKRVVFKLIFCILVFLINSRFSFSQKAFFNLELGGGVGIMRDLLDYSEPKPEMKEQVRFSYNAGISRNYLPNKYIRWGFGLSFVQINSREDMKLILIDSVGAMPGSDSFTDYFHASYFAVPIYFGYKIGDFCITMGFQTAIGFYHKERSVGAGIDGGTPFHYDHTRSWLHFGEIDYGIKPMISYIMSPKISSKIEYFYGRNKPIFTGVYGWRNEYLTIGMMYRL